LGLGPQENINKPRKKGSNLLNLVRRVPSFFAGLFFFHLKKFTELSWIIGKLTDTGQDHDVGFIEPGNNPS
jgi:hypothetical protein